MTGAPLLSVQDLTVEFDFWGRPVPAVQGVSFQLMAG